MDELVAAAIEQRELPTLALKALAGLPEVQAGPLSALAHLPAPPGEADRSGLAQALAGLHGDWAACLPALVDPGLSLALVLADRERQRLAQFCFADAHGLGAGFAVEAAGEALRLRGPFTLEAIADAFLSDLGLPACREIPPARFELGAAQLWVLLALVDAHATAAALRMAARASGPPPALPMADIEASWNAGLRRPNPAWAVSLVALLAPDEVPRAFPGPLRAVLDQLAAAGLATLFEAAQGDPLGDLVAPGAGLELLCRGLSDGASAFGLVRSERIAAGRVEIARIAGWRTPGGIALLELGALAQDRAELLLCGPAYASGLLRELIGVNGLPEDAAPPTPAGPDPAALLAALQGAPAPAGKRYCSGCGAPLRAGARFCGQCGQALG